MIDISKTVFFVDGQSDLKALKAKFQKEYHQTAGFRLVICNGKSVSAAGYANAAVPSIIFASNQCFHNFICIIDKEKRQGSAINFADSVKSEIDKLLTLKSVKIDVKVCCADIMFENWIVADLEGISSHSSITCNTNQSNFDGKNGTALLKSMFKKAYKKTAHAADLFKCVCLERGRLNSPSLDKLCRTIEI